jgi:N-methylhydantoinase B
MIVALIRTAFSTNIKDRRDCSGAIFNRDGELVAQGEVGTPLHVGVMPAALKTTLNAIPVEELEPDDDIIMNTPYPEGPGHLNDVTMFSPVFYKTGLIGFVGNTAHHVDMGGFAPGSMPFGVWEHYQEGLQIPPVKISHAGKMDMQLVRLISQNLRTTSEFMGDLKAQIAANNVGKRRIQALLEKYGKDDVQFYMQELMNYSERRILSAIRTLPHGSHSYEDFLEGDGFQTERIKISVRITVSESEIVADFSESDPQVLGPVNCRPPTLRACFYYVVKAILDPGLPPNSGAFRPLSVITKPATLVDVEYPGALCNANIVMTQRVVDVLMGAFAQIIPARVSAACSGTQNLLNIGGRDPRSRLLYNYVETYGGGQGAFLDRDGTSAVHTHMTNTRNAPVEIIESTYPLFIPRYGLVPESAGAGRFRGGFGLLREITVQSDETTVTLSSDRFALGPWGLFGGLHAKPGYAALIHPDGTQESLPPKITRRIAKGDRLVSVTPGGGGWGNPLERPIEEVDRDVVDGLISRETALKVYGVVMTDDLLVDIEATEKSRKTREVI